MSVNSAGIRHIKVEPSRVQPDNLQCQDCGRTMVKIFLSQACDYCDYGLPKSQLYLGFVVWDLSWAPTDQYKYTTEYVFRDKADAERWMTAGGREGCEIREVYSMHPYRWQLSRGSLRDIILADEIYEIYQNHKYGPDPHRAHLIP